MVKKDENTISKDIQELKKILTDFIIEQRKFNEEQKQFNIDIDKKVDKVQYFLEKSIAETTKLFFDEQGETIETVKELEDDVFELKNQVLDINSRLKIAGI